MEFSILHFDVYYIVFRILPIRHNTTKQSTKEKNKSEKEKKEESQFKMHKQEGEHEENKQLDSQASDISYFS